MSDTTETQRPQRPERYREAAELLRAGKAIEIPTRHVVLFMQWTAASELVLSFSHRPAEERGWDLLTPIEMRSGAPRSGGQA